MMFLEKEIEIKINNNNKRFYEDLYSKKLRVGDKLIIKQKDVQKTSRIEVECKCDLETCGKPFFRKRVDVNSKSGKTFCGEKCRNENFKNNNPNPEKDKIKVQCATCNKEIFVHESEYKNQKHFLCSKECYREHRSVYYRGENIYNFQDIRVNCNNCGEEFKVVKYDLESRNHHFCKPECYYEYRKANYTDEYYSDRLNDSREETIPEKLVRNWLDNNNINYIQEFGFAKKYYIDFYLPDYRIFLEVYGDYWHSNPKIYGDGVNLRPLNENQIIQLQKDIKRRNELESYGYKVLIIWEDEVHTDINLYMGKISEEFNKNPQRLHALPLDEKGEDIV